MEELLKILYSSVNKYINNLSILGYTNYEDVYKLLSLIFVEELLNNESSKFITNNDYINISKFINNIYGSNCIINFPRYINSDTIFRKYDYINLLNDNTLIKNYYLFKID